MSPVDHLLNQVKYPNRSKVKTDIDNLVREYRTLVAKIADFGKPVLNGS
jgi:hypothetical protein